jgi:diguanylate cyclase (GGDEF)-like protein
MARYGGEEFAMILPDTDLDQALQMGETIRARAQELAIPHERNTDPSQLVTVSIGITSQKSGLQVEMEALIGYADRALYQAKRNGRNLVAALLPAGG